MNAIKIKSRYSDEITDTEVIHRILKGEKELFEILLRRYNQTLYRVVRGYTNCEDDLEDIVQESYLKAFSKLSQFKGGASFSTWLIRIAINEALQYHRDKHNSNHKEPLSKVIQLPGQNYLNPENSIMNKEMKATIEKSIEMLPEKLRVVFILHEIEGMQNHQIGECLDLSDSNVKVRLHRAKKILKKNLYKTALGNSLFEFGNQRCDKIVRYVMKKIYNG